MHDYFLDKPTITGMAGLERSIEAQQTKQFSSMIPGKYLYELITELGLRKPSMEEYNNL